MHLGITLGLYGIIQWGNALAQENICHDYSQNVTMVGKNYSEQPQGFDESIGLPTRGKLRNGFPVYSSSCLDALSPHRYATQDLSDLLHDVSCHMYQLTGARLQVKDISRYRGGIFPPHKSHQNGLDVDVGHYYLGSTGIRNNTGLISGNVETMAMNWEFIRALSSHSVQVQYIFWSPRNISNLRQYVVRTRGLDEWKQYGTIFYPEKRHKHHMHIRIEKPVNGLSIAFRIQSKKNNHVVD